MDEEQAHQRDYETKRVCREAWVALNHVMDQSRCKHLGPAVEDLMSKLAAVEAQVVRTWD